MIKDTTILWYGDRLHSDRAGYMGKEWRRVMIHFLGDSLWSVSLASESVETESQGCNHFRSDPGV